MFLKRVQMPLKREQLEKLSVEALLSLLNPDFNIGKTYFKEVGKKFMITHNYKLIFEINSTEDHVDEWETFGFPTELLNQASIESVFGKTPRECLLKFFELHPGLILYDIKNVDNYS
jgi:hypothetical protein